MNARRLVIALAAVVAFGVVAAGGYAYYVAQSAPNGSGAAVAGSIDQVTGLALAPAAVTPTADPNVPLTWNATTLANGDAVDGYVIHRHSGSTLECAATHCTENAVPDGVWKYGVQAKFGALWLGPESSQLTVEVDTSAPTITGRPADPSNDRSPTFSFAHATFSSFECRIDGGSFAPCAGTFHGSNLSDGNHTFRVAALDASGYATQVAAYTWTIDTVAPAPTVSAPAAFVNTQTPTISGTAGTQVGDASTVTVKIFAGPTLLQTFNNVAAGGGTWSVAPASLPATAQYTAQVGQDDAAGNTGTAIKTFVVDTAAPAPTVTAPAAFVNSQTPTISGTAGTQGADASHSADSSTVTVEIYSGATLLQTFTDVAAGGGTWTVTPGSLPANAQYSTKVTQFDAAGNSGTATKTFVIDTVAPAPTVTTPVAFVNSQTPTISGTAGTQAADASHSVDSSTVTVEIYSGATLLQTIANVAAGSGTWTVVPDTLPANAQYSAKVTQLDAAGNSGSSGNRTFVIDTTAPVVTLGAPAGGSATNNNKPTFSGTAGQVPSSSTASADSTTVTVFVCAGTQASCNAGSGTLTRTLTTAAAAGAWSVAPSASLADGTYTAQAAQADGAGNTGTSSVTTFTVDTRTPPAPSSVSVVNGVTSGTAAISAGAVVCTTSSLAAGLITDFNRTALSVDVGVSAGTLGTDSIVLTATDAGAHSVQFSVPAAAAPGTVHFTSLNISGLTTPGTITFSARTRSQGGTLSTTATTTTRTYNATKPTTPDAAKVSYTDNAGATADQITTGNNNGATDPSIFVTAVEQAPTSGPKFSAPTSGGNARFTMDVAAVVGSPTPVSISYLLFAVNTNCNVSSSITIGPTNDTR